ncbi:hypothetical protein [Helicobacter sp. MIT 14-3879]|uniref:GHMP family kinase ATP-binding protein n=1 Tax=Helicobacter sp. MIT 14-3879 TaxID=2040649 RepID=UPI000E1F9843|nr:hypothetical protein [Helicobacter sp. MIT 14-3879]RDU61460.1 hypothetical protein CQA44_08895 [Helicobacter sp. MIT 14-3879]
MPQDILIKAYPKINIALKIYPKDSQTIDSTHKHFNNLHKIASRFCLVLGNLHDIMQFKWFHKPLQSNDTKQNLNDSQAGWKTQSHREIMPLFREKNPLNPHIEFILQGNFDCEIESNLIYKAYKILLEENSAVNRDWQNKVLYIKVIKNIPTGSGLGGGSVNAAISLIVFNTLFGLNLSVKKLLRYAQELGSDVPFFVVMYLQGGQNIHRFFLHDCGCEELNKQEFATTQSILESNSKESLNTLSYQIQCKSTPTHKDPFSNVKITTYCPKTDSDNLSTLQDSIHSAPLFFSANVFGTGEIIVPFFEKMLYFTLYVSTLSCHTGRVYAAFDALYEKQANLQHKITDTQAYLDTDATLESQSQFHTKSYSYKKVQDSNKEEISPLIDFNLDSKTLLTHYTIDELNDLYQPASAIYPLESVYAALIKNQRKIFFSGSGSTFFSLKESKES